MRSVNDYIMASFLKEYAAEQASKILSWSPQSSRVLKVSEVADWWIRIPNCSTFRVNTLRCSVEDCLSYLHEEFTKKFSSLLAPSVEIYIHDRVPECIVVGRLNDSNMNLQRRNEEVVVDAACGAAVLRGSNVFAPGVMGMTPTIRNGTEVSIYADIAGTCLKGHKKVFASEGKLFLGNGVARMNRSQLFDGNAATKGIAVELQYPVSGLLMPSLPNSMGILQNLPSMVCVKVLDPKPGDTILDMCAAPGNKTTHIGALMNDEGTLVAIDRKNKVRNIASNCRVANLTNCIKMFAGDSTKLVAEANFDLDFDSGPPFFPNSFDKILLDVACSGTGLRPMLTNKVQTEDRTLSFSVLQKQFMDNAVKLLKPGGTLVYSTCSILCEENECLVAWTLEKYPEMLLVPAEPIVGGPGLSQCGLSQEQRFCIQRFGMNENENTIDSIGFFIAKFVKL